MTTNRFARSILLWGDKAQNRLKNSTVLVAGCGAVGSFALEALARAGVGHIIVVDCDTVGLSNINRQIIATESTLGQQKTTVAAQRLRDINPAVRVTEISCVIGTDTVADLVATKPDFAIDAIDSLSAKAALITALSAAQIPFISSMGAALKRDMTQIKVMSMNKTKNCPLAAMLRKKLRRAGVPLNFKTVSSTELAGEMLGDMETSACGTRTALGSLVTITGTFGLMCAHEALCFLTQEV